MSVIGASQRLHTLRTIFSLVLAFSLASGPARASLVVTHSVNNSLDMDGLACLSGMAVDAQAGMDAGMANCDRAMPSNSSCDCCDTKSTCPDQAACLMKCCSMVLGTLKTLDKTALPRLAHVRPADPLRPPDWPRAPPTPPPRT